jgi:hypothetical protein
MQDMLWIEDIIVAPLFLTNFRIDMIDFMDPHKLVVKRNAFKIFSSA